MDLLVFKQCSNHKGFSYSVGIRNLIQYKIDPLTFENDCCITEPFQSNKEVEGLCPTRNSANLISGATLQSTQIQAGPKFAKEMTPTVRNTLK